MSLLDDLIQKAATSADEHAADWLDKGLTCAREELAARRDDLLDDPVIDDGRQHERTYEFAMLEAAGKALDAIERYKGSLVHLGRARFAAVLAQLGVGRERDARRLALATSSTFAERRAASAASVAEANAATADREQAWRDVKALARELGLMALKAAIPLLIAVL